MEILLLFDNLLSRLDMRLYSIGSTSSRRLLIWLRRVHQTNNLIVGTIGQKAGFTETLDTQVKKILNTTATALKKVAVGKKPHPNKGQPQMRDEEFLEVRHCALLM
jgi:RNA12 protein